MSDWRTEGGRREERGGRDEDHGRNGRGEDHGRGGRGGEPRQFGGGRERFGDDDRGVRGSGGPAERIDTGAGDQGQDRFGHSGGFQGGYNDQGGAAGFGPLSHGSTYGQGGSTFGHSGWTSHDDGRRGGGGQGERGGRDDFGFRGQGGGGQQWGERSERSGGSYGQNDFGRSAQRSQLRTDQYDRNDREGFGAQGRGGEPPRHEHDHDHEPGYRAWRESQLSGHDRDYQRWRDEQARRYDDDYKSYRTSRHETFSKGFGEWRAQQAGQPATADAKAAGGGASQAAASSAASAGGGVDANPDALRSVTDGGSGEGRAGERHEADPKH